MRSKYYLFFIGLIFLAGCASQTPYISKTADNQVLIDGNLTEWQHDLHYFSDMNFGYSVKHNADNIYLILVTNDRQMMRQIQTRGLLIWFDENGKTTKQTGIKFPVGIASELPLTNRDRQRLMSSDIIVPTEFEYHKKGEGKILMQLFNNQLNIQIEPIRDRDIFAVEMAIPRKVIYNKKQSAQPFKLGVCIELAKIDRAETNAVMRHHSGKPSGGIGSRSGSRQDRRGRRPNSTDQIRTPLNFEKWLNVQLSED